MLLCYLVTHDDDIYIYVRMFVLEMVVCLGRIVTATLVSKEHAKGDQEGVQAAVCQALFIAFLLSIAGTSLILLRPDFVLSSVLGSGAPAMNFAR